MADFYTSSGKGLRLGKTVGAGGEATVFRVEGQPARLVKIYTGGPRPGYAEKLAWMASHPPEADPGGPGQHSLAWPLDLVYAGRGRERALAGYLMPFVRDAAPALQVFNPRLRLRILPGFDRRYLHRAARNLASAMAALHTHDYVVGDVNESNILVARSALVTLIDVDSFQVSERAAGGERRVHPCPVGKFEYTAPELQGLPLAGVTRTPEQDAFALAVLVFQLLMEGNHPFRARWEGRGEPPPLEQRIAAGMFPYVAGPVGRPFSPPQGAPRLELLAPRLAELFRRCFADGHAEPALRPRAAEWARALAEAERGLIACPNAHYYAAHLRACPVCGAPTPATQPESSRPQAAPRPARAYSAAGAAANPAAANTQAANTQTPTSPPPGVRNPRPAAAPAGARPIHSARPNPQTAAPHTGGTRPAPGAQAQTPNAAAPNAELQRRLWGFARRQAVTYLRRRYPWIPEAWAGAPASGGRGSTQPAGPSSAGAASSGSPGMTGAAGASQGASANPATAGGFGAPTATAASGAPGAGAAHVARGGATGHPGAGGGYGAHGTSGGRGGAAGGFGAPAASAAQGGMPAAAAAQSGSNASRTGAGAAPAPGYYAYAQKRRASTPNARLLALRDLLRTLASSALRGAGWGALAGALPALAVASAAGLLGESAGWLLLAGLGGAAGAAVCAWAPGLRLETIIERRIGWRRLLGILGLVLGAALGAVVSLPVFFLVIPVALGLYFGGRIGLNAGRKLYDLGRDLGWGRVWRGASLTGAGALGAWLGSGLAGSALGLQFGAWAAAQAAAFSGWVGSPAAAWALAGALAGGLGGGLAGFIVDLPARLTRLTD